MRCSLRIMGGNEHWATQFSDVSKGVSKGANTDMSAHRNPALILEILTFEIVNIPE